MTDTEKEIKLHELKMKALTTCIQITKEQAYKLTIHENYDGCLDINGFTFFYHQSRNYSASWFTQLSGNGLSIAVWEKTQKECLLSLCNAIKLLNLKNIEFIDYKIRCRIGLEIKLGISNEQ